MKKTILFILLIIAMMLCGCKNEAKIGLKSQEDYITFYTDPVTKVDYIIYHYAYQGGICPRYNPDGSLFVREGEQE